MGNDKTLSPVFHRLTGLEFPTPIRTFSLGLQPRATKLKLLQGISKWISRLKVSGSGILDNVLLAKLAFSEVHQGAAIACMRAGIE